MVKIKTHDIVTVRPGWPRQGSEGIVILSPFFLRYHYALLLMLDSLTPEIFRLLGLQRVRRASKAEVKRLREMMELNK